MALLVLKKHWICNSGNETRLSLKGLKLGQMDVREQWYSGG
jgi:hypothetical protein